MIKRLSQSVRQYKRDAILTPILVVGEVIMDVIIPMLISNLIDYGINAGNMNYIYRVGFQLILACLISLFSAPWPAKQRRRPRRGLPKPAAGHVLQCAELRLFQH